jgi:hypothetical protein
MLNYIKFFVYTSTLFFCSFGFGQTFVIDFDNDVNWTAGSGGITSYQTDHEYNDQNWLFTGGPALRQLTTAQDGFPGALGTYSWRLRDSPATWNGTYNNAADIVSFGFDVRRWDGSPNPDWDIEYSTNGGGTWTNVGNINNTFLSNSSDWISFSYTLPSVTSVTTGDFVVQVSRNGGERIMIDNFTWTEDSPTNTINTSTVSPLSYTVDCTTGQIGDVDFTTVGNFNIGNEFTAQLSDATGSFAAPISIGTLAASGTDPSGTINITIPAGTLSGTGYRIRVISDDPSVIGSDNGVDITINLSGGPCVLEPPHMSALMINACDDGCSEGQNELVFFNTGDYSVEMNSSNFILTYGSSPSPTANYTDPMVTNPGTTDDLNTEAGCPGLFIDGTGLTIPPNSPIMLALDDVCPDEITNLSGLCGSGPIYVIYTTTASAWKASGNFVNTASGLRYLTTEITSTDGNTRIIDYSFDSDLNINADGDYALWNSSGGLAYEHGNNNCEFEPNLLPVELIGFYGLYKSNSNQISWTTATELNNNYFNLYYSSDGKQFSFIHKEEGHGTTGNQSEYEYIHYRYNPGINYYKLESVDYDGTVHDKGIISVLAESSNVYYNESISRIIFSNKSNYALYSPEGRLIETINNRDSYPFTGKGIYFIINTKTGEKHKLFTGY